MLVIWLCLVVTCVQGIVGKTESETPKVISSIQRKDTLSVVDPKPVILLPIDDQLKQQSDSKLISILSSKDQPITQQKPENVADDQKLKVDDKPDVTIKVLTDNQNSIHEKGPVKVEMKDKIDDKIGFKIPLPADISGTPLSLLNPSISINPPTLSEFVQPSGKATQVRGGLSSDRFLQTLALTGGLEDMLQNPLLFSRLMGGMGGIGGGGGGGGLGLSGSSQSDFLALAMVSGGMENPLLLTHLLGQSQQPSFRGFRQSYQPASTDFISTLALTGAIDLTDPIMLTTLLRGSPTGGSQDMLPLLALAGGGGEAMMPLLLSTMMSESGPRISRRRLNATFSSFIPPTLPYSDPMQDMLPLMMLSGGGEMNPLMLTSLMSGGMPGRMPGGGKGGMNMNMKRMLAMSGGEMGENPLFLHHMMRGGKLPGGKQSGKFGKHLMGGGPMSRMFPLMMGEMSENPMMMMMLMNQGGGLFGGNRVF